MALACRSGGANRSACPDSPSSSRLPVP